MVSILIPAYQRIAVLKRCVESVLPQVTPDMEVIIIDDGSQDGTKEYLQQLAKENSTVKIHINAQNQGVNYTRNRGIEIASKKYILFLDSDDELYEGSLAKVTAVLRSLPDTKHFLFIVSDRAEEFANQQGNRPLTYKDWITTTIYGDFTHVVLTEIMKKFLFFEQYRAFEHLNWLRIKKITAPQLIIPVVTTKRERDREDSLGNSFRYHSAAAIRANFEAEKFYYSYYHDDLKIHYPRALNVNLLRTVVLGVASGQKSDSRNLLQYAGKGYVKLIGRLITLLPSSFVRSAVIRRSASKAG